MPAPTRDPGVSPPAPLRCSCGYDLAGLPADADAKCPECGAVIAELKARAARWPALIILGALIPSPVVVWMVGIHTSILMTLFSDPLIAGFMLLVTTAASAVFISVPALIAFAILADGHESGWKQLRVAVIIYVIAVLVAGTFVAAVLTI